MILPITSFASARRALERYLVTSDGRTASSLEREAELLEYLGNPHRHYEIVHVAGTSGKTSTAYYAAALLKAAGKRIGLIVSPHVYEINERVQVNLEPLAEREYCTSLHTFLDLVHKSRLKPTYIELLTAFSFWELARAQVDYAVVESGVGGLLDVTNQDFRRLKTCVITDIGYDHQDKLGNTLPEIAVQKAGIVQLHDTVFCYRQSSEVMERFAERGRQKQADIHIFSKPKDFPGASSMPLFQQRNFYLALQAISNLLERNEGMNLEDDSIKAATQTYIPGRMEIIRLKDKVIILDGAHNAQKLQALHAAVAGTFGGQKPAILFSMVVGRDYRLEPTIHEAARFGGHITLTNLGGDNAAESEDPEIMAAIAKTAGALDVEVIADPAAALAKVLRRPEKLVVVTGSFYNLSFIRSHLKKRSVL